MMRMGEGVGTEQIRRELLLRTPTRWKIKPTERDFLSLRWAKWKINMWRMEGKKEALKRPQWIVLIIKKKRGKHPTAILFNYGNRLFFCLIAVDADMETSAIPWKSSNIQRLLLCPFFQIAGSINKTWRFSLNICFHPFFYLRNNPQSCDEMDQSLDLAGKKKKVFGKLSSKGRKWSINRHLWGRRSKYVSKAF